METRGIIKRRRGRGSFTGRLKVARDLMYTVRILCNIKIRIAELANVLGINIRSAYRIIAVVKSQGLPVQSERRSREILYWLDPKTTAKYLTRQSEKEKRAVLSKCRDRRHRREQVAR